MLKALAQMSSHPEPGRYTTPLSTRMSDVWCVARVERKWIMVFPVFDDLRSWLALMEDLGELRVINGADWNLEIGAISRLNYKHPNPKALLFDNIIGYE